MCWLKAVIIRLIQSLAAKEVIENGGRVVINPLIEDCSTTGIIEKIKSL